MRMKCLVVDDMQIQIDELLQDAEDAGGIVSTAVCAVDALALIERNSFDLVITDIFFGQKPAKAEDRMAAARAEGFAVLNAAKERDPYCQVIVVTNYGEPALGIEAMKLGAFDYIDRGNPTIDFQAMLTAKIARALEYRETKLAVAS